METDKSCSTRTIRSVDYPALSDGIRTALAPALVHLVSMHDIRGELLWLSEGSMGPDEHNAVAQAFEVYATGAAPAALDYDIDGEHSAVLFRVADSKQETAGAVMVVLDSAVIRQHALGVADLLPPSLEPLLEEFAASLRSGDTTLSRTVVPVAASPPSPVGVSSELDQLSAELRATPIELHVQRLVQLGPGVRQKCYEVLLRSRAGLLQNTAPRGMLRSAIANGLGSMIDRRVLTELITWLVRHRAVWDVHKITFTVNLTRTALHDPHFLKFVELCLAKSGLPKGTIGFEIDVATAVRPKIRIADIASTLQQLGCPIVLDDFNTRSENFLLLHLPGISCVKLAPDVTASLSTNRIARTAVMALVQRVRALGIKTVAKRARSRDEEPMLTELGVDYVQAHAFSLPVTIDSVAKRYGTARTKS